MNNVIALRPDLTTSFVVEGRRITCGTHSIERYWQRAKPNLPSLHAAAEDLERVATVAARITVDPPDWTSEAHTPQPERERTPVRWLVIGDAIALPLTACRYTPGAFFVPTCLVRGCVSDITLAARAERRQARARARRRWREDVKHSRARTAAYRAARMNDPGDNWLQEAA
jgi:hypothetical protein